MSTNSLASYVAGDDRDGFVVAVHKELVDHGFREISRPSDNLWLWKHEQARHTVLGVTRDRDHRLEAAHDPLEEAVLFVGGESRRDQLYLIEVAVRCWWRQRGADEPHQELHDRATRASDRSDGDDVAIPGAISFREMLGWIEEHRSDLEERFSPVNIVSTLEELSEARYEQLREQLRTRLVALLVPDGNEGIPGGELPPGVEQAHRPEFVRSIDFEALVREPEGAYTKVPLTVTIENGPRSDHVRPGDAVESWLQEPNSALGGRSPDDILRSGDQAKRESLFGLIAGIECGVHS